MTWACKQRYFSAHDHRKERTQKDERTRSAIKDETGHTLQVWCVAGDWWATDHCHATTEGGRNHEKYEKRYLVCRRRVGTGGCPRRPRSRQLRQGLPIYLQN